MHITESFFACQTEEHTVITLLVKCDVKVENIFPRTKCPCVIKYDARARGQLASLRETEGKRKHKHKETN